MLGSVAPFEPVAKLLEQRAAVAKLWLTGVSRECLDIIYIS